jgi:hypothetical protein
MPLDSPNAPQRGRKSSATLWAPYRGKTASPKKEVEISFYSVLRIGVTFPLPSSPWLGILVAWLLIDLVLLTKPFTLLVTKAIPFFKFY